MRITSPERTWQDDEGQWWYAWGAKRIRTRAYVKVCVYCQEEFVALPQRTTRFCSKVCSGKGTTCNLGRGAASPRWQGGRRLDPKGYVQIWQPEHHSIKGRYRKYVLEHRLVMEDMLGRPLLATEEVHHKNGKRDDNHPDNLELWVRSQPPGVRAHEGAPHCATCRCFAH